VYVSHGWASVRTSSTLGRYSSAIRAACANERSCGSARGAISDGRPYRDRQLVTILLPKSWAIAWSLGRFYSAGAMAHLAGRKQWDFILEADWFERNACCTTSEAQLVGAIKVLQCRLPPSGILTFAPLLHLVDAIAEFLQTGVRQVEIGFSNALHVPKNNNIGRHIKLLRVPRPARVTVAIRR